MNKSINFYITDQIFLEIRRLCDNLCEPDDLYKLDWVEVYLHTNGNEYFLGEESLMICLENFYEQLTLVLNKLLPFNQKRPIGLAYHESYNKKVKYYEKRDLLI